MEIDELQNKIQQLEKEEETERQKRLLRIEIAKLEARKWDREHPRLSRFKNFFGNSRF